TRTKIYVRRSKSRASARRFCRARGARTPRPARAPRQKCKVRAGHVVESRGASPFLSSKFASGTNFTRGAHTMQLGMIGLGRMGANMVRRLTKAGHQCVVYDRSADAVKQLAGEGAMGSISIEDFVKKLQ